MRNVVPESMNEDKLKRIIRMDESETVHYYGKYYEKGERFDKLLSLFLAFCFSFSFLSLFFSITNIGWISLILAIVMFFSAYMVLSYFRPDKGDRYIVITNQTIYNVKPNTIVSDRKPIDELENIETEQIRLYPGYKLLNFNYKGDFRNITKQYVTKDEDEIRETITIVSI